MSVGAGKAEKPQHEGVYAVEVYFGWKLMEWHAGDWWHTGRSGRWTACQPVQWVGPLPDRIGGEGAPPKREFDL